MNSNDTTNREGKLSFLRVGDEASPVMPTRRVFLMSGLSTLGFVTTPLFTPDAYAAQTLDEYVTMFTNAMGGGISRYKIDRYLSYVPKRIVKNIMDVNKMMEDGGFNNFSAARVYGFGNCFYYPVINKDGYNVCMPFFSTRKPGSAYITMVEGPSLVGLALCAKDYTAFTNVASSRRVLLPTSRIRNSMGSFKDGYVDPDEYTTLIGKVKINYTTAGRGMGTVHVTSTRTNPNSLLMNKNYDISYLI